MQEVSRPTATLALHGPEASRRIEQLAQAALPPHTLMRRAGLAVARLALALAPHARTVWIAAGPGNNGGDGLEAAITLLQAGKEVQRHAGRATRRGCPPTRATRWPVRRRPACRSSATAHRRSAPQDLAIDALLGLGASRAPQGRLAELIAQLNALPCPVLAVDLPSGLDGLHRPAAGRRLRSRRAHAVAAEPEARALHGPRPRPGGRSLVRRSRRGRQRHAARRLADRRRRGAAAVRDPAQPRAAQGQLRRRGRRRRRAGHDRRGAARGARRARRRRGARLRQPARTRARGPGHGARPRAPGTDVSPRLVAGRARRASPRRPSSAAAAAATRCAACCRAC